MFDKNKLAIILKECQGTSSLNEYARNSDIDVGYLCRIINKKKSNPPSPKILRKIADTSKGLTTYNELMQICGYGQAIERTAIEQGAIEYLEGIVNRQEPGWSLVDITLNYIKRLEGGGYMLNTQKDNKNKNATTTQL